MGRFDRASRDIYTTFGKWVLAADLIFGAVLFSVGDFIFEGSHHYRSHSSGDYLLITLIGVPLYLGLMKYAKSKKEGFQSPSGDIFAYAFFLDLCTYGILKWIFT